MKLTREKERELWTAHVEGRSPASSKKGPKYANTRLEFNGRKFDSIHEANYAQKLQLLEAAGKIRNLEYQVKFVLVPRDEARKLRAITYWADFVYEDPDGTRHVLDAKGFKTDIYRLKKLLAAHMLQLTIEEV